MGRPHSAECAKADPGSLCDCDCAGARHAIARSAGNRPAAGRVSRRAAIHARAQGRTPVVGTDRDADVAARAKVTATKDPPAADTLEEFAFGGDTGQGSLELNAALRGLMPMKAGPADLHRRMQTIFDRQPPMAPTVTRTFRMVSGDKGLRQRLVAAARKREVYVEPGYSSTTTSRDIAQDFAWDDDDNVLLQISVMRGAPGVVDLSAAVGDREFVYDQQELVLNAGTRFHLSHPEKLPDGTWRILAAVLPERT